jgi:hypothetical protein
MSTLVVDAPAGVVCDFAVHEDVSYTQNITRFFDDAGDLIRVEDEIDLTSCTATRTQARRSPRRTTTPPTWTS